MFLSGKKLFMYRLNQIKNFIFMSVTVLAVVSAMFYMCVAF
jgi:hypothetical protein